MRRLIILLCFLCLVCGCSTPESKARLAQLETKLGKARVELVAASESMDSTKVATLENEISRLNGALMEAGNQVAREKEMSWNASLRDVGAAAGALAPILGYFLPGAAGVLQLIGGVLSRRKDQ